MTTTTQPRPAAIPMILIISEAVMINLPAEISAGIRHCEWQYMRGSYYITVPAERHAMWQEMEKSA